MYVYNLDRRKIEARRLCARFGAGICTLSGFVRSWYIPVELNTKYDFLGRYAYTYILCIQLLKVKRYYSARSYRAIQQIIQNDVANRSELTNLQLDSTYSRVTSVINFLLFNKFYCLCIDFLRVTLNENSSRGIAELNKRYIHLQSRTTIRFSEKRPFPKPDSWFCFFSNVN